MARTNRISGKGGSLLDKGVAALAALSGGFFVYAMPESLFSRVVAASGLAQFVAAAQPPLGMKARLAAVAAIVVLAYAFVGLLMRALDGIGRGARTAADAPIEAEAPPRLRRADAHPDAPSRRPILAGRDLGEPEFDEEPLELAPETAVAPEAEPESEPLPAFLVPQEPEVAEEPAPAAFEAGAVEEETFEQAP